MSTSGPVGPAPEILDAGPQRELDPRLVRAGGLLLVLIAATLLVVHSTTNKHHSAADPATAGSATPHPTRPGPPAPDLVVSFEQSRPMPATHETLIDLELTNVSGGGLQIKAAAIGDAGVPISTEVLSRDAASEALAESAGTLAQRFGQPTPIAPLSVVAGQWFNVLLLIKPNCANLGNVLHEILPASVGITYVTTAGDTRSISIPSQDVTGALSWLDDGVAQACGTMVSAPTVSETRTVGGIEITTSGPATVAPGPFEVSVTATNLGSETFDGAVGVFLQGQMFTPQEGATPYRGGLSVGDQVPGVVNWRGGTYDFDGTGWYRNGVLRVGERMVPGGSFVWTFRLTFSRPDNSFGETQGWQPLLVPADPSRPAMLPDLAIEPAELQVPIGATAGP